MMRILDRELEAAHRAGLHNVAKIGRAPLAFDTGPCLRFPNQAQFHPLKYLAGLAQAIERGGGRIYAGTHATGSPEGRTPDVATEGRHGARRRMSWSPPTCRSTTWW